MSLLPQGLPKNIFAIATAALAGNCLLLALCLCILPIGVYLLFSQETRADGVQFLLLGVAIGSAGSMGILVSLAAANVFFRHSDGQWPRGSTAAPVRPSARHAAEPPLQMPVVAAPAPEPASDWEAEQDRRWKELHGQRR
jgi:hypothetical protein